LFGAVIRPAAFDLDGTLVRDRTCVESIARAIGREEECAAFGRLDMRWLRGLSARLELPQQAVAAVGDSDGDRELLEAAGVRYCVGERKVDVAEVVHMPRASILEIARQLVAEPS
jgi:phosphoserine phosphatase